MRIIPKWYGGRPTPKERAKEQMLLRKYQEKLQENRLAGIAPGEFRPTEGPYAQIYNREVGIAKKKVRPNDIVLDIGAGRGRFVEAALDCGAGKVIALEPDPRALAALSKRFKTSKVEIVRGVAEDMGCIEERSIDLVTFTGNSLGMMWEVVGNWETMICRQKEALLEMLRVSRREVSFIVYGKETLESSLKAYEPLYDNVVNIQDGLMMVEIKRSNGSGSNEIDRLVYQKFDREYLENLLADVLIVKRNYSIVGVPDGKEYGYLVTIRK